LQLQKKGKFALPLLKGTKEISYILLHTIPKRGGRTVRMSQSEEGKEVSFPSLEEKKTQRLVAKRGDGRS